MEYKQFKATVDDIDEAGMFEGHASVFGNVDKDGDVMMAGSFTKTLKEHKGLWPVVWFHNPDELLGGADLEQDKKGLKFKGQLNMEVQQAVEKRALMRQGVVSDMSFGFRTLKDSMETRGKETVRLIHAVRLFEISPLPNGFAANPKAGITIAKATNSLNLKDLPLTLIDDIEQIKSHLKRLAQGPSEDTLMYELFDGIFIPTPALDHVGEKAPARDHALKRVDLEKLSLQVATMRRELNL